MSQIDICICFKSITRSSLEYTREELLCEDKWHKKGGSYLVHKAPTFARMGEVIGRQSYPQIFLERLIPKDEWQK